MITLEQLAAQQAQDAQQGQEARKVQTLEQVAADAMAAKLSSLRANTEAAIKEDATPGELLQIMAAELFDERSAQYKQIAERMRAAWYPGGMEYETKLISLRRNMLKRQRRQALEMVDSINAELEKLDAAEQAMQRAFNGLDLDLESLDKEPAWRDDLPPWD